MDKKIIACIDNSNLARRVCQWSAWLANQLNTEVKAVHVLDKPENKKLTNDLDLSGNLGFDGRSELLEELTELDEKRTKIATKQGKALLKQAQNLIEETCENPVTIQKRSGSLHQSLIDIQEEIKVSVLGRQGLKSQGSALKIGSQLENVIRSQSEPVFIAVSQFQEPKKCLILADDSPETDHAIRYIAKNFSNIDLEFHLLLVGKDNSKNQIRLNMLKDQLLSKNLNIIASISDNEMDIALNDYCKEHEIDFAIMRAYRYSKFLDFCLGSVTNKVLQHTDISLLILH